MDDAAVDGLRQALEEADLMDQGLDKVHNLVEWEKDLAKREREFGAMMDMTIERTAYQQLEDWRRRIEEMY